MANTNNMSVIGCVISALVTISGGFFIYEVLANADWTFVPEWNMFKSVLLMPFYIIGIVVMLANWNRFSFAQDTYIKTTYRDGTSKTEKSYDIVDVIFGHFFLPLIGRFVIVPLMVSAMIYYPLMCIVWLVGGVFPYVLAVLVLGIIILSWTAGNLFQFRNQTAVGVVAGLLFAAGFAYGGYAIEQGVPPTAFEQSSSSTGHAEGSSIDDAEFDEEDINEAEYE